MRITSKKKLRECWGKHRNAEQPLKAWYFEVKHANWKTPTEVKQGFLSADFLTGNRVIFNIKGNRYRIIAVIHYNIGRVYIRFAGTHAEYDKINAEKV